ncbi:deoxyhypusine hydroxylase [Myriangium duriaei CBS 260.36]|uniref:Deoxyhypusine hydroxylase n=1 Tax=Myriangium duriaei CBS 260.36 TaxID=1168546 RepID=A0A9P4IUE0_9PEZI|nr:deoxyhypusine hydroxylase [Myriangium duriaei CBS 260.36]
MAPSAIDLPAEDGIASADTTILSLRKCLVSEDSPLAARFRALFSLKHLASQSPPTSQTIPAIESIAAAFASPSALLKHELAYCLGQTRNFAAVPHLTQVLENKTEDPMCRHEAAEALGALGHEGSLALLKELRDNTKEQVVVRETCEIAVERIEWEHSTTKAQENLKGSDFASIDPAPPTSMLNRKSTATDVTELEKTLLDDKLSLFIRYRAMFALRDLASPPDLPTAVPAVHALAKGLADKSALFRHEIAFVFGQLSHPASIPALAECLGNQKEESMVRHEAAEALGSLGDEDGVEDVLKRFINDPEQVVRESIIVALDMAEFERAGEKEYATVPVAA